MIRITLAGAAALALAAPTLADGHGAKPDGWAAVYANTIQATYEDGSMLDWRFNADKTFTAGNGLTGTWRAEGDQFCVTAVFPNATEEEERCATGMKTDPAVGDSWTVTGSAGDTIQVTLKEGREDAGE